MELVTTRVPSTRMPWRQLGVLALLAVLLSAILALYIGGQQHQLPAPFGVAGNGLVAYSANGDIFVGDRGTLEARRLTSGPQEDANPVYSPDGQRIAFLRRSPNGFDLMVLPPGGSDPLRVSTTPVTVDDVIQWAPDSTWLLIGTSDKRLLRVDAVTTGEPSVIATDAILAPLSSAFRPPDGRQIAFVRESIGGLWVIDVAGGDPRLLIDNPPPENRDFRYARWSPDGSLIAYPSTIGDGEQYRIFVASGDGTDPRRLSTAGGVWVEQDLRWSPDGKHIAFNRWQKNPETGVFDSRPIGLLDVATGAVRDLGPAPASEGALFDWSPDGTTILSLPARFAGWPDPTAALAQPIAIDVSTGTSREVVLDVASNVSWQRVAH